MEQSVRFLRNSIPRADRRKRDRAVCKETGETDYDRETCIRRCIQGIRDEDTGSRQG